MAKKLERKHGKGSFLVGKSTGKDNSKHVCKLSRKERQVHSLIVICPCKEKKGGNVLDLRQ